MHATDSNFTLQKRCTHTQKTTPTTERTIDNYDYQHICRAWYVRTMCVNCRRPQRRPVGSESNVSPIAFRTESVLGSRRHTFPYSVSVCHLSPNIIESTRTMRVRYHIALTLIRLIEWHRRASITPHDRSHIRIQFDVCTKNVCVVVVVAAAVLCVFDDCSNSRGTCMLIQVSLSVYPSWSTSLVFFFRVSRVCRLDRCCYFFWGDDDDDDDIDIDIHIPRITNRCRWSDWTHANGRALLSQ